MFRAGARIPLSRTGLDTATQPWPHRIPRSRADQTVDVSDTLISSHEIEQLHHYPGSRSGARALHAESYRLYRRRLEEADHRGGEHLDRDHALQLQPA